MRRWSAIAAVCAAAAMLVGAPPASAAGGGAGHAAKPASGLWATQLDFDDHGAPWSVSSLAALRADGLNSVEIDMPWNTIEPAAGTFDFAELDQELANASAAGIRVVPIFWQSGWGGSPASWITSREQTSSGAQGPAPAWWDATEQQEYFDYVTDTVAHIRSEPAFGGAILDYGFLDAQWDVNGGAGGWATADVAEFHEGYLPRVYGTVAAFNSRFETAYTSFDQVPAATPGEALASVYQAFRAWSVQDTYDRLTAVVRAITQAPLYYYFGGHFADAPNYANIPAVFFRLAARYDVTIILDDAQSPGLTLTFGSLARAYRVKLAQEWTAPGDNDQLDAQAVQWLSNYAMGLPDGGGEDFFIHDGTTKDVHGFPLYTHWLSTLQGLSGSYPQQPAAVYLDFSKAYGDAAGGTLGNVEAHLTSLWNEDPSGFAVVTSDEVADGTADLSRYRAVLPLNGVDATLDAYAASGGRVLTQDSQLAQYAPPYVQLTSTRSLQVVPAVAHDRRSASLTLAEVSPYYDYHGSAAFSRAGLGLVAGTYHLVDAATGVAVPQLAEANGDVCAPVDMSSAQLAQWLMQPGPAPAGTPVPSVCPIPPGSAESTVSVTAGQSSGGMRFLGVGQTGRGSDGNLTLTSQDGEPAVATWTSAQSGAPGAYVYLQVDPSSSVATSPDLTVQVTYWATPGQGYRVQYNAPGNPYQNGPAVSSPGTDHWTTSTVPITGAQLAEAENGGADLRLAVSDSSLPLIVRKVTISTTGPSSSSNVRPMPNAKGCSCSSN
ncbi:MAG TPA: beta-galactosidase [Actinopolymorphaceae bacterium]|nr:beta-galactosidase [Actinopolymorphaceae bacterium]